MKIEKYTVFDFEIDVYNILVTLISEDKRTLKFVKHPAQYLMNKFNRNKEYTLANKMKEIIDK